MTCELEVKCRGVQPGQWLAVSGEASALGAWALARALPLRLVTDGNWTGRVPIPDASRPRFKLVILEGSGELASSEGLKHNRRWPVEATAAGARMRMKFGKKRIEIEQAPQRGTDWFSWLFGCCVTEDCRFEVLEDCRHEVHEVDLTSTLAADGSSATKPAASTASQSSRCGDAKEPIKPGSAPQTPPSPAPPTLLPLSLPLEDPPLPPPLAAPQLPLALPESSLEMPVPAKDDLSVPHDQEMPVRAEDDLPAPHDQEMPVQANDDLLAPFDPEMPVRAKDESPAPHDQDTPACEVLPGAIDKTAATVSLTIQSRPWHLRPSVGTWLQSRPLCVELESMSLDCATKELQTQKAQQHPWPRLPSVGTWMMARPLALANHEDSLPCEMPEKTELFEEDKDTVFSKLSSCTDGGDISRPPTDHEGAHLTEVKQET
mmetsp:Transcript_25739/g.50403  ORF Transcript_25739/g.50403 Transcript_25739/m.50403 type:complete len:432 (-) Transcript_25739:53-1348(-)